MLLLCLCLCLCCAVLCCAATLLQTWSVKIGAASLLAPSLCQVVFVATEVAPWSKVGGLGDVLAALPIALAAR